MTPDEGQAVTIDHDEAAALLDAYALDALDPAERDAVESHLASCARCRAELVELRRVTAGIGLSVAPEAPPEALRARTLERAVAGRSTSAGRVGPPGARPLLPWLLAAASLLAALGASAYAWSLRGEVTALRALAAGASERIEALRTELQTLRQDAVRLQRTVSVASAPDLRRVSVSGMGRASAARGLALWSPSNGLVFMASQLPPLESGRGYELWVIPPGTGAGPVSLGMLAVSADGTASQWTPLTSGLALETVAVSVEAAGGSATGTPQGPIVMAGKLAG